VLKSYLSYKIAIRGAWSLGQTIVDRKELFTTLRKAYQIRSSVAHGESNGYLHPDDLLLSYRVEDILRQCIRLWLHDTTQFKSEVIDLRCLGALAE